MLFLLGAYIVALKASACGWVVFVGVSYIVLTKGMFVGCDLVRQHRKPVKCVNCSSVGQCLWKVNTVKMPVNQ